MLADFGRFTDRLVDDGIERDPVAYELTPRFLRVRRLGVAARERGDKSGSDRRRQRREAPREDATRASVVGPVSTTPAHTMPIPSFRKGSRLIDAPGSRW
jgi:hypothetical protein